MAFILDVFKHKELAMEKGRLTCLCSSVAAKSTKTDSTDVMPGPVNADPQMSLVLNRVGLVALGVVSVILGDGSWTTLAINLVMQVPWVVILLKTTIYGDKIPVPKAFHTFALIEMMTWRYRT